MLHIDEIKLRVATSEDKLPLYSLLTTDEEWTKFNGPYFPYSTPTLEEFESGMFKRLCEGIDALLIEFQGEVIGSVSYYWEDQRTRWLEVGVIIYDSRYWNKGVGRKALIPWITHLFNTLEIARVGLTTWSGNPRMVACAQSIGMTLEARLRKVRYFQGQYYDSVKLGVLREEWVELQCNEFSYQGADTRPHICNGDK
ncbi:GNAT family N-acetyltransferase [Photobacterium proteolyticum]|uniref:GNAT family N-acetyltransferase n=1 Tax=Photobacterium proteolyticum TaxID=1903952 RepID=UPI0009525B69|nr:GNAT family protein [Photobacterium proteolyticum]